MGFRCTETEVKAVKQTALTNEQVTPYLRAANVLVTAKLSGQGYAAEELKEIEIWLAAHMVCAVDPDIATENTDGTGVTYDGRTSEGLGSSRYGQNVMLLEYQGILKRAMEGKPRAAIRAYGAAVDIPEEEA